MCADIGLNAANSTNKVVTFKDIADLEGSMHFKGVTTVDLETGSTVVPTDVYSEGESPKAGDVVINETTLKEFVWGGAAASWHELGHEGVWATQEALNNEVEDRKTAVKDLSTALDDKMKYLSSDT